MDRGFGFEVRECEMGECGGDVRWVTRTEALLGDKGRKNITTWQIGRVGLMRHGGVCVWK